MLFSKESWVKGKPAPISMRDIKKDKRKYFYIGRSDIKGEKVYFIVSENIIPRDQNSHIFENSFFNSMEYNTEYEIPSFSLQRLQETVRDKPNYVIRWIQPTMVNGIKIFIGKRRNASHTEPQLNDWIKDSFYPLFQPFYDEYMHDANLNKHLPIPAG